MDHLRRYFLIPKTFLERFDVSSIQLKGAWVFEKGFKKKVAQKFQWERVSQILYLGAPPK